MKTQLSPSILSISDDELQQLYQQKDFPLSVRGHSEKVIVLMTQDWCPQWIEMQSFLTDFTDQTSIFVLVYNTRRDFDQIREFKENQFGNFEVPYIRYYFKGDLITETNWLPRNTFAALLTREKPFRLR